MRLPQIIARRLLAAVLVTAAAGLSSLAVPPARALASAPVPVLIAIHAIHYREFNRLIFQFAGPVPVHRSAYYVPRLPGSAGGSARLMVTFSAARGYNAHGQTAYGPAERSYALPGVIQVATVQDDQTGISFGVALARREPLSVFALARPSRVVIDVRTPYPTVLVRDYFASSGSVGGQSVILPASRPVLPWAAAPGALQRLFAGPTQDELARGMRFVASGATGFTGLTIGGGGVARVRLTGGCSSSASAVTVATEIESTLRQFPQVRWVKIYDAAGHTEQPSGHTDSIPACLKPSTAQLLAARFKGPGILALLIIAGLGILAGLVLSVLSIVGGLALRADTITPSAYLAERIKAKPAETGQFEPDTAWPFYPFRQARADLARIEAERRARYRKMWTWPFHPIIWIILAPVSAAAIICILVAGLTTVVIAALFALVTWTCAAIIGAAFVVTAILLRGADKAWHTGMRTEASCPHPQCYHVTAWPAYKCPGCQALHRDIRPGRLGLFTRRCQCGTLLPTMVLRAAWHLDAVCQRCEEPLRLGSAALRDVRIPIFGDTSAGKTRFLYAALDSLIDTTQRAGIAFSFPDENSRDEAALALDVIRSGHDTVKTPAALPTALTCRVGTGASGALVHLFDAAGESFRGAEMHDSLGFLDHGHGLVYVLDPFSVGSVRDRMTGHNAVAIRLAHAAAGDPETAYGEVVSRLRDSGVEAGQQRLAVIISKADLLTVGGLELPEDSGGIADWLMQAGVHNLVLSARRDFAEVRYFAVASLVAEDAGRSYDPGAPVRWLLSSRGVRLPAADPLAAHGMRITRRRIRPGPGEQAGAEHSGTEHSGTEQSETAKAQP